MANFHASTKPLSRSAGRSAVAAMSYRTGTVLVDERTGLVHDYTRRGGVEHAAEEVVVPRGCRTFTRQALWNAAERAEQRKDARTAREWELGLPCELSKEQRIELVRGFAEELATRYGTAVDYALHEPSKRGDQRNYHAHVMMTTRQIRNGQLQEKALLEWNDKKLFAEGHAVGRKQVEEIRELWAGLCNRALERAGSRERVDHRSLKAQQAEVLKEAERLRADGKEMEAQFTELKVLELDRTPQTHVGWQATAMGRDGKAVERVEMRESARKEREQRRHLVAQLRQKLRRLWSQTKTALAEILPPKRKQAEKSEAAVKSKAAAKTESEWLLRRFAGKTLDEAWREIEWWRRLASQKPPDPRAMFEVEERNPTARAKERLEYEKRRAFGVKDEWKTRCDEMSAILLIIHDKGWKKDRQLAELEAQHAEIMKRYRLCESDLEQVERRWMQQRPTYEQRAGEHCKQIERAKRQMPLIDKIEVQTRDIAAKYQEQQRAKTEERAVDHDGDDYDYDREDYERDRDDFDHDRGDFERD